MAYKDKKKQLACQRKHYNNHKEYYFDRNLKRRIDIRNFINSFKNKPCMDCGNSYPVFVMDFDHRENKKVVIALVAVKGWSKERILKEIEKCDLVCANCHRIRTHERIRNGATGNTLRSERKDFRFDS